MKYKTGNASRIARYGGGEMGHSSVERRLRNDIAERHRFKNDLEKKQSLIVKLTQKFERTKKKKLNKRYSATIKRLNSEIEGLGHKLNEINLDLQRRIAEEMEFSEEEMASFREQYQEELAEIEETETKLQAIEEGTDEADVEQEAEADEEPAAKELIAARTRRMLKRERRTLESIQKEIKSEELDGKFFTEELHQIMAELEAYKGK
jgi:chromosome segregation ATPase